MLILIVAVGLGLGVGATHPAKVKAFGKKVGCVVTFRSCPDTAAKAPKAKP
jgi:hypothetical protein